uniref:Uncharacterized protein n=1 Tax=Oryza sativa subsp. japonica TaxID=39947 RepID=Q653A2_ORYSJ|nr:hypothetical protein [Oryza sativa Japonica Group]
MRRRQRLGGRRGGGSGPTDREVAVVPSPLPDLAGGEVASIARRQKGMRRRRGGGGGGPATAQRQEGRRQWSDGPGGGDGDFPR